MIWSVIQAFGRIREKEEIFNKIPAIRGQMAVLIVDASYGGRVQLQLSLAFSFRSPKKPRPNVGKCSAKDPLRDHNKTPCPKGV